jgi:hypothetical protein
MSFLKLIHSENSLCFVFIYIRTLASSRFSRYLRLLPWIRKYSQLSLESPITWSKRGSHVQYVAYCNFEPRVFNIEIKRKSQWILQCTLCIPTIRRHY